MPLLVALRQCSSDSAKDGRSPPSLVDPANIGRLFMHYLVASCHCLSFANLAGKAPRRAGIVRQSYWKGAASRGAVQLVLHEENKGRMKKKRRRLSFIAITCRIFAMTHVAVTSAFASLPTFCCPAITTTVPRAGPSRRPSRSLPQDRQA